MIEEIAEVCCQWCCKPCGELPMDTALAGTMTTLHPQCYSELCEAWHRLQGLDK